MAKATLSQPVKSLTTGSVIVVSAVVGDATLTYIPEDASAPITPVDLSGAGNPVLAGTATQFNLPTCEYTVTTTGEAIVNRGNHG